MWEERRWWLMQEHDCHIYYNYNPAGLVAGGWVLSGATNGSHPFRLHKYHQLALCGFTIISELLQYS
jgi:hypothetical protein